MVVERSGGPRRAARDEARRILDHLGGASAVNLPAVEAAISRDDLDASVGAWVRRLFLIESLHAAEQR